MTKIDRARVIISAILDDRQTQIRHLTSDATNDPKSCGLLLRNGVAVSLQFTHLTSVFAILDSDQTAEGHDLDWVSLQVRVDGQIKLQLRYRRAEIDLLSYAPGQWERRFGVNPGRDTEILLPLPLRDANLFPFKRSGIAQ